MSRKEGSIFNNWQAKLVCFCIAVCIYLVVMFGVQAKRTIGMPLHVILPEDYVATSVVPTTVNLVVSGSEDAIYLIDVSDFELTADFSAVEKEGVSSAAVRINMNGLDDFVNVNSLSFYTTPAYVRIYFEKK